MLTTVRFVSGVRASTPGRDDNEHACFSLEHVCTLFYGILYSTALRATTVFPNHHRPCLSVKTAETSYRKGTEAPTIDPTSRQERYRTIRCSSKPCLEVPIRPALHLSLQQQFSSKTKRTDRKRSQVLNVQHPSYQNTLGSLGWGKGFTRVLQDTR